MDSERDYSEELANAMIPFEENGTLELPRWFTPWQLIVYARNHPGRVTVEQDENGTLRLNLGLHVAPDGSAFSFPNEG